MARKDRTGNKKSREQRGARRIPELGYYIIVTDTEGTERCYFNGLYNELPPEVKGRLVIKVIETDTENLIAKCQQMTAYEPQYRMPWIVFDRDEVRDFDRIIAEAQEREIHVGWSNPCFEIWMYAYFGSMPVIEKSRQCCESFSALYRSETGRDYSKTDRSIYSALTKYGDEQTALRIAGQKHRQCLREGRSIPSSMIPCTTVYQLIQEIRSRLLKEQASHRE